MLFGAKLPQNFWAEAIPTAVYFRNHSATKAVDGMTPFEVWHGEKPQINHLRVFGCISYAHVSMRHKLDSKARKYVLLGYGTETKGYRLYDPEKERILCSCDVVFNKSKIGIERNRLNVRNGLYKSIIQLVKTKHQLKIPIKLSRIMKKRVRKLTSVVKIQVVQPNQN